MLSTDKLTAGKGKLKDRWIGPFPVIEVRENGVNVRLDLPKQYSRIHPVFHVEKLKRFIPSSIDWPARTQPKRPRAKVVDGKKQFWAVRIIGKKEEEKEFIVREEQNEGKDEEIDNEQLQTKEEMENKTSNVAEQKQSPPARRVSPREHASTRRLEAPRTLAPPVKKPRARLTKVKRMVLYYKVEWEGYPLEDATWKPADELVEEGLQWMIDDYEMAQHQKNDELDLASMYTFSVDQVTGGVAHLCVRRA